MRKRKNEPFVSVPRGGKEEREREMRESGEYYSEVGIFCKPQEVACISPPTGHGGESSRNLLLINKHVLVEASFRRREATLKEAFKSPLRL